MTEHWSFETLGHHVLVQNGYAFSSGDYSSDGHFVMRIANVQDGYVSKAEPKYIKLPDDSSLDRFVLSEGDILMSLTGNIGRVALVEEEHLPAVLNQRVARINVRPSAKILTEYLLYFLQSDGFREKLSSSGHGVAQQNVSTKNLVEIELPFPSSPEQSRIVAILDEAFHSIAIAKANAEKIRQNAVEIFESHLATVFSARNDGWTDRRLHSLCQRIKVGHVGSMADMYKPTGIPFLRSQNIRPFALSLQNLVFIDEQFHTTLAKSSLRAGDVAIVRTGYPGTAAVIPEALGGANCSDLVIITPGSEVDAHFLAAFFNSAFGKSMVSGKVVGAAQKHFNVGAAKDVVLHLPPLAEQRAIVAASDELRTETDRLAMLYTSKLTALDELKKSLLQQAFSGAL